MEGVWFGEIGVGWWCGRDMVFVEIGLVAGFWMVGSAWRWGGGARVFGVGELGVKVGRRC